ncbi:hypothetical protein [Caballeronia novacaledonica]|uniref:Uncharacterized protein n=1 Tax=Caballeronia novacaledonica TaxID=1544861 RepID=A0AA37IM02_9BURK|nr:hypothetical protein [Caballeronia novacaledonica]GJH28790.1 hypothetical protein CBA19CS42_29760 [Caballeronia novacaledonica]
MKLSVSDLRAPTADRLRPIYSVSTRTESPGILLTDANELHQPLAFLLDKGQRMQAEIWFLCYQRNVLIGARVDRSDDALQSGDALLGFDNPGLE